VGPHCPDLLLYKEKIYLSSNLGSFHDYLLFLGVFFGGGGAAFTLLIQCFPNKELYCEVELTSFI
jgi:hypothetical protein